MTPRPLIKILKFLAVTILALMLLGTAAFRRALSGAPSPGTKSESLESGGLARTYLIHVPASYDAQKPVPLILVLHGATQSPASAERMSKMSQKSEQENFIVVYPSGTGRMPTWNSGSCCAYAMKNHIDDVGFLRALIDKLESDYSIDRKRIFVTGTSNGGMMSYRVGCELSDKVAAIAPSKAPSTSSVNQPRPYRCSSSTALRTISSHSMAAPRLFKWAPTRSDTPVSEAVQFWVRHDACSTEPKHEETSELRTDVYSPCKVRHVRRPLRHPRRPPLLARRSPNPANQRHRNNARLGRSP